MALITLGGAHLAYGHVPLLDGASFALEAQERVALVGRNGTGKSSLLKVLAGLERPDDGELQLQELVPQFLLDAAQVDDIPRLGAGQRQRQGTEAEQFVNHANRIAAGAEVISEVDDPVALAQLIRQLTMQRGQALAVAVDGRDRPDAPRGLEHGVDFVAFVGHGVGAPPATVDRAESSLILARPARN